MICNISEWNPSLAKFGHQVQEKVENSVFDFRRCKMYAKPLDHLTIICQADTHASPFQSN